MLKVLLCVVNRDFRNNYNFKQGLNIYLVGKIVSFGT